MQWSHHSLTQAMKSMFLFEALSAQKRSKVVKKGPRIDAHRMHLALVNKADPPIKFLS